jgi:hypothetical protein
MQQDLCHRLAVDPKKTTSCTFAHTINVARPTNPVGLIPTAPASDSQGIPFRLKI